MGCGCRGGGGGRRPARQALGPISTRTVSNQSTRNNISIQSQSQGEVKINGMTKAQREEERKKRVQNILKKRRSSN